MEHDRRDLAIAMRRKMNDWFRIMEILQHSTGPGDDQLLKQACNHVGDYYADRQNWTQAAVYYEKGENYNQLIRCYLMNDNYEKLENLSKRLPDGHELLKMIGEIFGGAGLCEQAVNCYLRCDMLNDALDVCIQLNQWDSAVQLSKTHNLRDVDALLGKYAEHLTGSNEKTLAAVQLYRRAGKFLEAARIVFDIASDERKKQAQPLRLKKLYVLGALLVEQYHNQNKAEIAKDSLNKTGAEVALKGLLEEDNALSLADSSLIDEAWRGAEAYHFYMLAQHQLYEGEVDAAMKTALHLTDFDDILDAVEVFSLLALASCAARQFSVCSRAFIKLESLTTIPPQERDAYSKLALTIFTKYPPKDTRLVQAECTGCDAHIPDYCQMCPKCDTKFPTCIVSGRPLLDYQFWLCPTCKHRAYEQEISSMRYCPLCHGDV
uniref:WD repeat-containing protein 35 n=1 Tax=Ascaris suum TaxID=6253 RepID=F1L3D6_ASCSU